MAGTFTIGEKKVRPGVYYRRENFGGVDVAGATNGILAAVFQADWGPLNKVFDMDVSMKNNIADYYGTDPHVSIIKEGFNGGAITIRAIRCGADDGLPASITLKRTKKDAETTDPDAVTITGAYPGTREFSVSVRTNLITDQREIIIYNGVYIFEKYTFGAGENEAANLIAAMASSKNFIAKYASGVTAEAAKGTLVTVTQAPLTGGKNPTVNTASYDRATNPLERVKWNCFIVDTDDPAVHALVQSFVKQSYETGHLGFGCLAGKSSQDLDERMSLAASYNDEKLAYVLTGWEANDGTVYDGYLAAARVGGMIASFESNSSLTHTVIKGALKLIEPLTNGEIIKAQTKGCITISLNDSDQIWIDSAINTLVTPDADMDEGWKKLRRTKTRFELMDRVNTTTDKLVGKVNNDTDGRQTVMAAAQKVINAMVGEKKLLASSYVFEDPANPAEGDNAWYKLAVDDIDSQEHIYLTYMFRFSAESTTNSDDGTATV